MGAVAVSWGEGSIEAEVQKHTNKLLVLDRAERMAGQVDRTTQDYFSSWGAETAYHAAWFRH